MRILIVPDKFKGTLTAEAAAAAISRGWQKTRPHDRLSLLPMSDGGDGFGEVMSRLVGGRVQETRTVDAAHRPCKGPWWWDAVTRTAIIDSARVIGLAMLPSRRFHPFELDTFGLGAVFRAASKKGAKQCLVGIGGSATNDGGFGLARALGWRFLDSTGTAIEVWTELRRLERISSPAPGVLTVARVFPRLERARELHQPRGAEKDAPRPRKRGQARDAACSVIVAVDVKNPLLGRNGATRVYGPQKGLGAEDFELAESNLDRLARVFKKDFGQDLKREQGAGAAGGLGFGLRAFLDARLQPGFDLFARYAKLQQCLRSVDLVITGEGAIDRSTLMGKGVGQIAMHCLKQKIPCIGLAGVVNGRVTLGRPFTHARALTEMANIEQVKARASYWLERLTARVAAEADALLNPPGHRRASAG